MTSQHPLETAIQIVKRLGFTVYMRKPTDRFMLFTEGNNIGYLQLDFGGGYSLTTVHMPNTTTGTGFSIGRHLSADDLTAEKLREAFVVIPHGLYGRGSNGDTVRKYRDIDHYRSRDSFNAEYKVV